MKRKMLHLLLALALCVGLAAHGLAADVPSPWAREQVDRAISLGMVPTAMQTKYDEATTRAEFCDLAVRLYEAVLGEEINQRKEFGDTTDLNVQKMGGLGVVNGVGGGNFAPDRPLTREQAAVILANLAKASGWPLEEKDPRFDDNGQISTWAVVPVGQMQTSDIMRGGEHNRFNPEDSYTREQSIATMLRLRDYIDKAAEEEKANALALTPQALYESMVALKKDYPEGKPWTNDDYYEWRGGIYSGGYGCAGFAYTLSDAAFGDLPARKHTDFSALKVGDVVRINRDAHSVVVLTIEGNDITVAEGNYNSSIHWGREFTKKSLEDVFDYIMTRYPEGRSDERPSAFMVLG